MNTLVALLALLKALVLIVLYALCLNGTNAKEDVTFGADDLTLQAKAVAESEVQEISEPRCHL